MTSVIEKIECSPISKFLRFKTIFDFCQIFNFFTKFSTFYQIFDFGQIFNFFTKFSTFYQIFDFDQIFNFLPNFRFWSNFQLFTKFLILAKFSIFLPNFRLFMYVFLVRPKNGVIVLAVEAWNQEDGSFRTTQNVRFGIDVDMGVSRGFDLSPWGYSHPMDSETYRNIDSGFVCWNQEQPNFDCYDYYVRFCCEELSAGEL